MEICRVCGFVWKDKLPRKDILILYCPSRPENHHPFDPMPESVGEKVLSKCGHTVDNPCDEIYAKITALTAALDVAEQRLKLIKRKADEQNYLFFSIEADRTLAEIQQVRGKL